MAESIVQVTEGSGKKLHTFNRTIGANSVEDEVVILGENYLTSYVATSGFVVGSVSTATANSHLMQIMAGASNKVRIRRIALWQNTMATTVTMMDVRVYRLTTAGTGGSAITPAPLDPSDGASGATAMTLPTVKGTESTGIVPGTMYMMQTLAASAQLNQPGLFWEFDLTHTKPLIINAGTTNGIAIKNITAVAAASVVINVWLDESSF